MFAGILQSEADIRPERPDCVLLPRSIGSLELHFARRDAATRVDRNFQSGVLRARFPNVSADCPPEAVLINTAGGLTGGDNLRVSVAMEEGTSALVTTQAHEKVYRSSAGDASIFSQMNVGAGATLEWLPQPTILFDAARLVRDTRVELSADATFLGVEAVIFGRTAMHEVLKSGRLRDTWSITREGQLIHADRFDVAGDIAGTLSSPATLANNAAMATIRYVADDAEERRDELRALILQTDVTGAASGWNGMIVGRIVAENGYLLHRALVLLLEKFRRHDLPKVWSI